MQENARAAFEPDRNFAIMPQCRREDTHTRLRLEQAEALDGDVLDANLGGDVAEIPGDNAEPIPEGPVFPPEPVTISVQEAGVRTEPELAPRSFPLPINDHLLGFGSQ
jgi:hypothetical protein